MPETPFNNNNTKATADDWLLTDPLGFDEYLPEDGIPISHDILPTPHDIPKPRNDTDMTEYSNNLLDSSIQHTADNAQDTANKTPHTAFKAPTSPADNMTDDNIESYLEGSSDTLSDSQQNEIVDIKFDGDTSRANPHFKPILPPPINRGVSGRQLIMDTETTGLDALKGDRVIEVGIIELVDRKFTGEKLHVYINPQRSMDEEVIRVHGITDAFLADKPTFDKVAQPIYDFMLGAEIIAHNASFDISFLTMEFDKVGLTDFADKVKVTDSLAMAKQQYPGQKNTLDALVRRLNVGKMDRTFHGALLDSEILAEVYLTMTGGQVALAIDEDTQIAGENTHKDFSHLASQLIAAKAHFNDHLVWIGKQIKQYPSLLQTQGVTCFYQIDRKNQQNDGFSLTINTRNLHKQTTLKLDDILFITS